MRPWPKREIKPEDLMWSLTRIYEDLKNAQSDLQSQMGLVQAYIDQEKEGRRNNARDQDKASGKAESISTND